MTNGANYKRGKLHHSPWHSDIRTSNQLNIRLLKKRYWCQGSYACALPHRHTCGNYSNTIGNVDASEIRRRCICKIVARDLRLVTSRLYRMAVTCHGSRATVTLLFHKRSILKSGIQHPVITVGCFELCNIDYFGIHAFPVMFCISAYNGGQ